MTNIDIRNNFSLQQFHTFGLNISTEYFVEVSDNQGFEMALDWAKKKKKSVLILGGGSNVLFSSNYNGLVIKNALKGIAVDKEDDEHVWVKSAAGETWHDLVMYCISRGWGGIENLSLIPGSVGAAPMQNIGAYGVEIKDVFHELEAMSRETLEVECFDDSACEFGYRESVFKNKHKDKYVILSVTLRLTKKSKVNTSYGAIQEVLNDMRISQPDIKDVSDAVIAIRQSKLPDPKVIGNAGSFFKNPVVSREKFEAIREDFANIPSYPQPNGDIKLAAGWLIDQCGWKGYRDGKIGVHDKQALVLVNHGGGNGMDIKSLSSRIQQSVRERFGVELHTEVNII